MTGDEIIHVFERSRLVSDNFTTEAVTASYVAALAALREQEERRWIPVTERLPEKFRPVIICREKDKGEFVVEQGFRDVGDWWKVYGTRTKKVSHWMPLPEPPKEG